MSLTDSQKRIVYNIIKEEGTSTDPNEYLWLAHVANNEAKRRNITIYALLMTGYSSAPSSKKVELSDTIKTTTAVAARTAVDDVLNGGADPTGGARYWDGTDFLAWGLKKTATLSHAKFRQYSSITIEGTIFRNFLANNLTRYPKATVKYGTTTYNLPADVFKDSQNWIPRMNIPLTPIPLSIFYIGTFTYNTGNAGSPLTATGAYGQSIFWKVN